MLLASVTKYLSSNRILGKIKKKKEKERKQERPKALHEPDQDYLGFSYFDTMLRYLVLMEVLQKLFHYRLLFFI